MGKCFFGVHMNSNTHISLYIQTVLYLPKEFQKTSLLGLDTLPDSQMGLFKF